MNPLLSIITPVYNVEAYLDRCVYSILSQSYRNIELILIDDGSTDGSSLLCDKWKDKDDRVVVIHKENGGVSSARNAGLKIFKGDYLTFVDSDDYLALETYSVNIEYMLHHADVDILQYPYCNYYDKEEKVVYHRPSSVLLLGSEQIFRNWWAGSPIEYVIWNKIFKRELWVGVTFSEGHVSEDTRLVPIFVKRARTFYVSDQGLYYYQRDRLNSYTFGEYDFDKNMDLFYAHAAIYECFVQFPNLITEKVLAFTRIYRRLISAKQVAPSEDIHFPLILIKQNFPSWVEIIKSRNTEKLWLVVAKIMGGRLFVEIFLRYLKALSTL